MINPEAVFDAPSAKRIHMPTLKETHQADEIAKLREQVSALALETRKLKNQLAYEKKKYRNLQIKTRNLALATGIQINECKKSRIIEKYKKGMTGTELAKLAGCSVRYANFIKQQFLENT